MKAVTFSTLRSRLGKYLDEVAQSFEVLIVPRNKRDEDAVVILSLAEYNALKETEYLMSNPSNAKHLMESMEQLEKGEKLVRLNLDQEEDTNQD